ncbi:MAG TPA: Gldg family protein, partial [Thermoanaerobaculia bacterium]|nr:Gldg family protein [Thermoanaerobaculia bacterium]
LAVAYGARPEAVLNGVGPEHLPRLQTLLLEALEQAERPRRPVVALAAPAEGFALLAELLAGRAEVVRVGFQEGAELPEGADLLLWLDPGAVEPRHLRALDRFLGRGRSAVVAGSELRVEGLDLVEGEAVPRFAGSGFAAAPLLHHFGLRPRRGLVLDARAEAVEIGGRVVELPFAVRSIAHNQDFRTLRGQPNGHLAFLAPTALAPDGERLARLGWRAEALASSSERTALRPLPDGPVSVERLAREWGEPVAHLPLLVLLRPEDPWRGFALFAGASTPFSDQGLLMPGHAHAALVEVLLDNLASPDRLLIHRAGVVRPEPLPEVGAVGRLAWRAAAVLALPAVLLAVATARHGRWRGLRGPGTARLAPVRSGTVVAAVLLLGGGLALAGARGLAGLDLRLDLSRERLAEPAPETRRLARAATGEGAVAAELVFTRRSGLPPHMRGWPGRARDLLRRLERAGAGLAVSTVFPEDLDEAGRGRLAAAGVEPLELTAHDEEETRVRTVYSALVLRSGGRTEVVTLGDAAAIENLEFRLAFALHRLRTGRRPHLAVVSDVPRLTPAEAHEQYQTQGLFAPRGADPYAAARDLLAASGFRVTHVQVARRGTELPEDADLVIWFQPRRRVEPVLEPLVRHLRAGGSALVAAQHFNVQPRQYRGTGFRTVYWPQPQVPEIDRLYFPEVGIHLVREVLFDELRTADVTETQVARTGPRPEMERQVQALPFLLRASAANFVPHPVTRGLGDQAFPWASYVTWDEERLERLGIAATPLLRSSERTWSFAWEGGWIPEELLEGPPIEDGRPAWLGRVALAALFEGPFPAPREPLLEAENGGEPPPGGETPEAEPSSAAPGRLLLVGASEPFKNHRLFDPDFRADHLLLNAVAVLALDEELAAVAVRRPAARGFDYVAPERRLRWRLVVLGAGAALPVAIGLGLGALLAGRRRRALGRERAAA